MSSEVSAEPDQPAHVIYVGQDCAGHWLVQDNTRMLEGRFVSRAAAMSFAEAERQIYHARLAVSPMPLTPVVPFGSAAAQACALPRAA